MQRKGEDLGFVVAKAALEADSPEAAAAQLLLQLKSAKLIRDQDGALIDATWHDDGGHKPDLPVDAIAASIAWTVGRKGPGTPSGIPGEDNPQPRQYEGGPKFESQGALVSISCALAVPQNGQNRPTRPEQTPRTPT
ncbi:MAG TPA: hypothetical protein VJT32_10900 [bacterium]|nr:hypothetical protein [bacterium]